MTINITAPKLGFGSTPIKISRWLVAVGDEVKKFTPIIQVETEYITTEINAPASGVLLEQIAPEGAVVTAGTILGHIHKSLNDDSDEVPHESEHKTIKVALTTLGFLFLLALIVVIAVLVALFVLQVSF